MKAWVSEGPIEVFSRQPNLQEAVQPRLQVNTIGEKQLKRTQLGSSINLKRTQPGSSSRSGRNRGAAAETGNSSLKRIYARQCHTCLSTTVLTRGV